MTLKYDKEKFNKLYNQIRNTTSLTTNCYLTNQRKKKKKLN